MNISSISEKLILPKDCRIISSNASQRGHKIHLRIAIPLGNKNIDNISKSLARQLKDLGFKSLIHFHSCSEDCDLQLVKTIITNVPNPDAVQNIKNHPKKGITFSYQNLYHFKEADALLLRELASKVPGEIIITDETTGEKIDKTRYLQQLEENRLHDRNIKTIRSLIAGKVKPVIVQRGRKRNELLIQYPLDSQFDLDALRQEIRKKTGITAVFEPVELSFITKRSISGKKRSSVDRNQLQDLMHSRFSDVLAIEKININKKSKLVEIIA
ncbi:MAG: hypothetical protein ACTSRU_20180, partial [Candidatus Hodarchaeales archaeon]